MAGTSDQPFRTSTGESLEPDRFWELVEKLLLRSSRDERLRHGHNMSLSALCRGYAVTTAPRNQRDVNTHSNAKDARLSPSAKSHKKSKSGKNSSLSEKKTKIKVLKVQNEATKRAKSECNLKDHDVVYVKDTEIPASEKLWRFAIKNRKQKEGGEKSINEKPEREHAIPSARSNEAIYEGLRQRLEEAKKTELEQKVVDTKRKSKLKPKRRRKHEAAAHFGDAVTKYSKALGTKKTRSVPLANTSSPHATNPGATSSQSVSSQSIAHNLSQNSASNDQLEQFSESSENTNAEVRSAIPEQVKAKKSLYDNVLKKRLHCGTQLETLNKEIVYRKVNPRLVLSRETTRKYAELKTDYLKLCYQESSLRHQIAMLQAEIYMMQNKNFHKRPAAIKTITFNLETAKLPQHSSMVQDNVKCRSTKISDDVLLFPRLKAPRPLIVPLNKHGGEKKNEPKHDKSAKRCSAPNSEETVVADVSIQLLPSIGPRGVCSLYSLTTSLAERHPKRQPTALLVRHKSQEKVAHRLPRMTQVVCSHN